MEPIYIPQLLKAPQKTEEIQVRESLPDLETLTPVRGRMRVTHQGNYLDVGVEAETIVTFTCHRCLQQFNHRVVLNTSELIWLDESADRTDNLPSEREVAIDELVEALPPDGYFNPGDWLYQQMCLEIPQRQPCDSKCPGIPIKSDFSQPAPLNDRRWASLESLKKQLPK